MKRLVALALVCFGVVAIAGSSSKKISQDPFTNQTSIHKTEVEPDTFSNGKTIIGAFQVGRFRDGGSSDIGWATSSDGGDSWMYGFLPGLTKFEDGGPYDRVSDASVAYDEKHNTWLVSSLALTDSSEVKGVAVMVNRSLDGGLHWEKANAVSAGDASASYDKNWTVCDNNQKSKYYGNCYTEWDDNGRGNLILMSTSTDGGVTWGEPKPTANQAGGLGGQPQVQPDGTVIVPIGNEYLSTLRSFVSKDGGATWSAATDIDGAQSHDVNGEIRTEPLPSAEIDASGRVYLVWQDCRFRQNCSANDIVLSTSDEGVTWSQTVRIPLDKTDSGMDHFIPGLAVDNTTAGDKAHLTLTYYFYKNADCKDADCVLYVGSSTSADGGKSWTQPVTIAGPIPLGALPVTTQGAMVGDYISSSYVLGHALTVFANSEGDAASSELSMYTSPALPVSSAAAAVRVAHDPVMTKGTLGRRRVLLPLTMR